MPIMTHTVQCARARPTRRTQHSIALYIDACSVFLLIIQCNILLFYVLRCCAVGDSRQQKYDNDIHLYAAHVQTSTHAHASTRIRYIWAACNAYRCIMTLPTRFFALDKIIIINIQQSASRASHEVVSRTPPDRYYILKYIVLRVHSLSTHDILPPYVCNVDIYI